MKTTPPLVRACVAGLLSLAFFPLQAYSHWETRVEGGAFWASRNKVRIPGDTGTRFDLLDLTGSGPDAYVRADVTWQFHPRQALRLTLVPLQTKGRGTLPKDVDFQETTFSAGESTRGSFTFNTYRLTYRWTFIDSTRWTWGGGLALLVRDAEIELEQGEQSAAKDDLGLVPLLHLRGEARITDRLSLVLDAEGAAASQGRAIDAAVLLRHACPHGWTLSGGYRTLEGGADNDEVYTFSWFHFAFLSLERRF